jgi:hypothetical protein
LNILSSIQTQTSGFNTSSAGMSAGIGIIGSGVTITPEFMITMGHIIIIVNAFLASTFIGVLGGGKIREGLKYAPIIAIVGIILFNVLIQAVGGLVGTFG